MLRTRATMSRPARPVPRRRADAAGRVSLSGCQYTDLAKPVVDRSEAAERENDYMPNFAI
ncbi:hypothetical protein [Microtetraspora malaysiensis]|uniref:hypothetical protein n=1 Tax=Microtetraspora malaysiensis TaxID=161358 RepID=UPI0012F9C293|nr:hypothetical protein [Microtetraspora malaysiensis]